MTTPPPSQALAPLRHEIKLVCPEAERHIVEAWMHGHQAGFRTAYPPRQVNNVYFDSHSLSNAADNLAGISDRAKLRLRWYGADLTHAAGVLELKRKHGGLGDKLVQPLARRFDLGSMTWSQIFEALRGEDIGPLTSWLEFLCCPTLINHYLRQYYLAADGLVRVTLDTALAFYAQGRSRRPNLRRRVLAPAVLIVEAKADAGQLQRLTDIVAGLPLRVSAFSKYTAGVIGHDAVL